MCNREKGPSDDKILAKYYNFSHFFGPWPGDKSNILFFAEGIVGNSEEYFW